MDCLISLLALCIFDPSNLTLRADASVELAGGFHYTVNGVDRGTGRVFGAKLEMPVRVSDRLNLVYGVEHTSLLNADDRGQERAYVGVVWTPFR